jgi:hypothetical protein
VTGRKPDAALADVFDAAVAFIQRRGRASSGRVLEAVALLRLFDE